MGKTVPTYRDVLTETRSDWRRFRKYLRHHQKPAYDALWEHAESNADAAGEANPKRPMDGILLSICLGQQRELARLQERVDELETRDDRDGDGQP